jgi:hypothetical protein
MAAAMHAQSCRQRLVRILAFARVGRRGRSGSLSLPLCGRGLRRAGNRLARLGARASWVAEQSDWAPSGRGLSQVAVLAGHAGLFIGVPFPRFAPPGSICFLTNHGLWCSMSPLSDLIHLTASRDVRKPSERNLLDEGSAFCFSVLHASP